MLVDEAGKDLDDFGAMFEAFNNAEDVTDRNGKVFHGRFSGIEGGVKFPQSVGNFLEEKNNLDTDDGGDGGENGNGDETDDLGQGHKASIPKLLADDGNGDGFGGGAGEAVANADFYFNRAGREIEFG